MTNLEYLGNRLFAVAASLVVSAVFLATAIAPANNGALLPGVIA